MSFSKKEREQYNERRKRVASKMGMNKNYYNTLRRVANSLSEADTNYANGKDRSGGIYENKEHNRDVSEAFKKAGRLRKKNKLNIHFYHQKDPRGASLYVGKKRMSQMDYNTKGDHIY
jgi:hypothetical protein